MVTGQGTRSAIGMAAATLLFSGSAEAADRALVGQAIVADRCPITHRTATTSDRGGHGTESVAGLLGTFGAGLVGDAVGALGNALGAALEQASRERTFSVEGTASFDFYKIRGEDVQSRRPPRALPTLLENGSSCLVLTIGESPGTSESIAWPSNQASEAPAETGEALLVNQGFHGRPALYVEAELQRRSDGFRVRPVLLWYRTSLPGTPSRRLPAELHVTFSVPGTTAEGQPQVFALARMPLPPMAPGTLLLAPQLGSYSSGVLPPRPTAGSPDTIAKSLADDLAAQQANHSEIAALERAIPLARQRVTAAAANAAAAARTALQALEEQLEVAKANRTRLDARAAWVRGLSPDLPAGSTNVSVRFALIRDANAFGMAIASALRTRSTALGTAVTTALTPEGRAAAWTVADTNYVSQMSIVDTKQRALNQAVLAGDAQAIFTAEQELRLAKAGANAAAAASDRAVPFPGLQ